MITAPQTEDEWLSWVRLLRSRRVGVSTFFRLMKEHRSAEASLAALPEIANAAGVKRYVPYSLDAARREWETAHQFGARPLAIGAPDYPATLAAIPDPPPFLWCIGNTSLLHHPMLAMVGARNASSLGARMARKLATDLGGKGHTIVSGLARGIDTAAHTAALETGTVAVMAGGVDVIYPVENTVLAQEIEHQGLRVSEIAMSTTPQARHFPRRNRIISGLASATIVIEAAAKSGSLITAHTALDQGREVLAVPGHPFDARASGCNMLIRDGATLVRGAEDVIAALERPAPPPEKPTNIPPQKPKPIPIEIAELHRLILDRLGPSPLPEDHLIRDLARPPAQITPEITILELNGKIRREPGGLLTRIDN